MSIFGPLSKQTWQLKTSMEFFFKNALERVEKITMKANFLFFHYTTKKLQTTKVANETTNEWTVKPSSYIL